MATTKGAAFIKLGRAPTTIMIFMIISSPELEFRLGDDHSQSKVPGAYGWQTHRAAIQVRKDGTHTGFLGLPDAHAEQFSRNCRIPLSGICPESGANGKYNAKSRRALRPPCHSAVRCSR